MEKRCENTILLSDQLFFCHRANLCWPGSRTDTLNRRKKEEKQEQSPTEKPLEFPDHAENLFRAFYLEDDGDVLSYPWRSQ